MLPVILSSASPAGVVLDFFSPAFSSLDWLAVASSAALVCWGLFLGLWIGSRIAKARNGEAPSPRVPENSTDPESKESAESPPVGDLAERRNFSECQSGELEFLRARLVDVREQTEARQLRLEQFIARERNFDNQGNGLEALSSVRSSVFLLTEAIQAESERRESDSDRLARLEARLGEEAERLDSGSTCLAEIRADGGIEGAGKRIARVDDQLRVLQQNVSGCASRVSSSRTSVETERKKLASLAESMASLQPLLGESKVDANPENVGNVLRRAGEILARVNAVASELRGDLDQELDEVNGRLAWMVSDSPSGFLEALQELEEEEEAAEVPLMPRDAWERLGALKGSLAGLSLVLESSEAMKTSVTGGKKQLGKAAERAIESIEQAAQSTSTKPTPGDGEPRTEAEAVTPPAAPSEELETLRFSMAARDGEIAKLRRQLAEREAELEKARAEKAESSRKETPALPIPETSGMNPVSARLAPVPVKRADGEAGATSPASSRQFLRRLLGIGNSRRNATTRALVESTRPQNGIAIPAATLVEARNALTQLRGRPAEKSAELPAGNGTHETEENADLRALLAESGSRIAELEAEVAALRHAAAVAEWTSKSETEGTGELELPGEIGSEAAGVTHLIGAEDFANEGCAIGAGESIPVAESERVIFRGLDPALWNRRTETENLDEDEESEAPAGFSLPLEEVPEEVEFLRLRRLDTGESVVASISREILLAGGNAKARCGWSGRGEKYFGASHLGLFDESLPREVETKFGAGGWGFGHRESIGSGQAYGWAGKVLADPGEGFEISVGPLPEGARIQPLTMSARDAVPSLFSGRESEPEAVAERPDLPLPITAATVAAAIAESASNDPEIPRGEEPTEVDEPIVEAETSPADPESEPDPQLDALAEQAENRVSGLVIFRANDPSLWGSEVFFGANRRARSLARLPGELAFLRLRRMDTGEGVVVPITSTALTDDGDGQPRGFNGSNETFYGAHHLGVFDESLPQDVETRFTYGGWGFGHSVLGPEQQACGWEGRVIAPDTVFEIAVFTRMPVLEERDRLVEA